MGKKKAGKCNKPTFLDLPANVREAVYRELFVFDGRVTWARHLTFCEGYTYTQRWIPSLVKVFPKIATEVSLIYCGENHFFMQYTSTVGAFMRSLTSRQARAVKTLTFDYIGPDASEALRTLKKATGITHLYIGVDEVEMIREFCRSDHGIRYNATIEVTPQLNLKILMCMGMDKLKSLRVPNVCFQPLQGRENSGPVPGGLLESVIAQEMMQRTSSATSTAIKAEEERGCFPFLKLPAELRNRIYKLLLVIPGSINPSTSVPTSSIVSGAGAKSGLCRPGPIKSSALAILQTNRQMLVEAMGIFYSCNHFMFYYPLQLVAFLNALGNDRRSLIRTISFWYKNSIEGGMNSVEVSFAMLRNLVSLREFHLIFDEWPGKSYHKRFEPTFAGIDILAELRNIQKFTIRDLSLEREVEFACGNFEDLPEDSDRQKGLKKQYRELSACTAELAAKMKKRRRSAAHDRKKRLVIRTRGDPVKYRPGA